MLDPALATQLTSHLEKLTHPIELVASLDDSETARDMAALLQDIATLSPLVTYRELRGDAIAADTRTPSFRITRAGHDMGITFAGLPMPDKVWDDEQPVG